MVSFLQIISVVLLNFILSFIREVECVGCLYYPNYPLTNSILTQSGCDRCCSSSIATSSSAACCNGTSSGGSSSGSGVYFSSGGSGSSSSYSSSSYSSGFSIKIEWWWIVLPILGIAAIAGTITLVLFLCGACCFAKKQRNPPIMPNHNNTQNQNQTQQAMVTIPGHNQNQVVYPNNSYNPATPYIFPPLDKKIPEENMA